MDTNQPTVYTSQDILASFQGVSLLQVLGNPAELRLTIETLREVLDLLEENEQRLYPDQAPKPGRTRRNKNGNFSTVPLSDTEQKQDRIMQLVTRLTTQDGLPPTMRKLRLYSSARKGDAFISFARIVEDMVLEGKLRKVLRNGTTSYAIPSPDNEPKEEDKQPKYEPRTHFEIRGQSVGAYVIVPWYSYNKTPAYLINGDADLAQHYKYDSDRLMDVPRNIYVYDGSNEYTSIRKWIESTGYECTGPAELEYFPDPTD